ncbi:protein phosphatase 1 regulatory subunit 37 isoform X2 [Trichomycterus rosablanca]|uniref:protein phosphatase 1 regulatory subunit 37 isoform X2 n=1 Tax=Trichomycterus rosablanca TaxID=2290929 RepID=UPI002F351500
MNSENQALDLCKDAQTAALTTEEIIPRNSSLQFMDREAGKVDDMDIEATDNAVPAGLTDCQAGHKDKEGLFSQNNNGTAVAPATTVPNISAKQNTTVLEMQGSRFSLRNAADDEDMDIGVDLSLDESGVLEPDPAAVQEDCVSGCASAKLTFHTHKDLGRSLETGADGMHLSFTSAELPSPAQEAAAVHKPGTKRVTFPSDEDIVSGSVEPKDPWRHAMNVTVEEILNAYRQACQKLSCKPNPKVLQQIQNLTDLTQRNECLNLKGEKLDYKTCESLEEIFKRVQFKMVNLEQTNLDEDGASALFDMIEYYESATHLNISCNKHMGTRGWQAAAHMMRKTSSLQYLDAKNTPLLDYSAPFVARALRISGSLTILHLETTGLSGRPLMLLATALKMNMNLRELYLAENKLNGQHDSAQLGNLLKFNYNIQILDLRNNHIVDSGLAYICEGLREQRKGLVTLVLWNNQLTHNGMSYLAAALPCTQSLETLILGHNAIGTEGVLKLKEGLIANRSILRLDLTSTKLTCEGAIAVAEFIAESPRLIRLNLQENDIKTGGLMALSLALKVNTSLLRLDLDREPKKETLKSFIETQRNLLTEIQNGCKRNFALAKEKEDSQQQMRQSVSMAEIATEDPAPVEEEEEPAAAKEVTRCEDGDQEEGEKPAQSQEDKDNTTALQDDSDTDSDTDDENDAEESKSLDQSSALNQTVPQVSAVTPVLSASQTPPPPSTNSTTEATNKGIAVTKANEPTGSPASPRRCISVSSPGRGHKIFMVTRVESPPEQQPVGLQEFKPKSQFESCSQTAKENIVASSPLIAQQTTENSTSAQQTSQICNITESKLTTLAEPASQSDDPHQQALGPTQTTTEQESSTISNTEATVQEVRPLKVQSHEENSEILKKHATVPTEHLNQHTCTPEATPTVENTSTVGPFIDSTENEPDQEEHCSYKAAQPVPSFSEQQSEINGEVQEVSGGCSIEPQASDQPDLTGDTEPHTELLTDEAESFATQSTAGLTLPNGLKPEFALHLLEPEAPKAACCVMEHMSVTAELSCGQDLEELLLEASLDTSRDAP